MKHWLALFLLFLLCAGSYAQEISVLQLNVWLAGSKVPNGVAAIANIIDEINPSIVLINEGGNKERNLAGELVSILESRGKSYSAGSYENDFFVLSTFPVESSKVLPYGVRTVLELGNGKFACVYSVHLNYLDYACYLPRGYSGKTWEKLESGPVTDIRAITEMNLASGRNTAIAGFIADAAPFIDRRDMVILGGDFNEPSHRDWTAASKDLFDHNGVEMLWHCTVLLEQNGFVDTYRALYPDPVKYPGITYPANNTEVDVATLSWIPTADDRDRIDFIFYVPPKNVDLIEAALVGPNTTITRGARDTDITADPIITPKSTWPTDHRGTFARLLLKEEPQNE